GLFSREVLEKLKKIAESTFEPAPKTTDSIPKPAVTSFDPVSVPVNFTGPVTINGSGFTKDSKVQIGGTAVTTTFVNDKQLTFVLPATSTAKPGKIDVTVVNAAGATLEAKQIEVVAG
ncbi:MAG TPA: IPT/TIG domain-containing protein, partial [Thermoanaerobaculia bacterium]|nr:IPT/TIG domain-containing protein [Thermoanaerobaculia bacterium]